MKITIMASLLTKGNMYVYATHYFLLIFITIIYIIKKIIIVNLLYSNVMIKGVLNGEFQSNLSKDKLNEFEVLEINHEKKEIILQKGSRKFQCKILKKNNKDQSFVIKINGNISTIRIVKSVEKTIEKLGINKKSQQNINILKAPMPGLILKLMVKVGDQIKKGEALIILEAMKMENILSSPVDGIIKEIKVKPQQTVEKNNVLINFES